MLYEHTKGQVRYLPGTKPSISWGKHQQKVLPLTTWGYQQEVSYERLAIPLTGITTDWHVHRCFMATKLRFIWLTLQLHSRQTSNSCNKQLSNPIYFLFHTTGFRNASDKWYSFWLRHCCTVIWTQKKHFLPKILSQIVAVVKIAEELLFIDHFNHSSMRTASLSQPLLSVHERPMLTLGVSSHTWHPGVFVCHMMGQTTPLGLFEERLFLKHIYTG